MTDEPIAQDLRHPAWHPIASSDDLPFRHVFHGQLHGRELAVWRADDGNVNIWENRCLHRGVRLSIGINEGTELKCQYHGWRYANRSAGCTYIPAHPADAPARTITNRTFPAIEAFGLVWTREGEETPFEPNLPDRGFTALRPLPVLASPERTLAALVAARVPGSATTALPPLGADLDLGDPGGRLTIFIQPVDAGRSVIRALIGVQNADLQTLRRLNRMLEALRATIEAAAAAEPALPPIVPRFEPVPVELSTMPDIAPARGTTLRVRVKSKTAAAEGVTGIEFAPLSGHLPTFQPGAHIDVHLPNGLVRQYSVTNGPGELLSYVIGVKCEHEGRGGSLALAQTVREGDVLAISEPRNNFPLRRDATRTILIAGGIGITPLLSMARALSGSNLPFELHAFARSQAHLPFAPALEALGAAVHPHLGLSAEETGAALDAILGTYAFARHVYVCGPGPMLEAVRDRAAALGWPEEAVHFEYFKNTRIIDDTTSFEIELARSAMTLAVPSGRTILEVLRENGIALPSSCEQGACGTCLVNVIEGEPDHQDVYLNESEKAANTAILTCVSRARSSRLVLDI